MRYGENPSLRMFVVVVEIAKTCCSDCAATMELQATHLTTNKHRLAWQDEVQLLQVGKFCSQDSSWKLEWSISGVA